jgi:hypothetical protein
MRCIALIGALASAAACWAQTAVTIAAHPESPGIAIAGDFIGLSFETGSLTTATGFPAERSPMQARPGRHGHGHGNGCVFPFAQHSEDSDALSDGPRTRVTAPKKLQEAAMASP